MNGEQIEIDGTRYRLVKIREVKFSLKRVQLDYRQAETILQAMADYCEIDTETITSRKRNEDAVTARFAAVWLMHQAGYTQSQIGKVIKRDHSTVQYALKTFSKWLDVYPNLQNELEQIISKLEQNGKSNFWQTDADD